MFDVHTGHGLADLAAQVGVITVEVNERFVSEELCLGGGDIARAAAEVLGAGQGEDLFAADIALFKVSHVAVDDQLHLLVHPVLQHLLDVTEIVLGHLHYGAAEVAALAVPVDDKVVGFVLLPTVEIAVVLHAVLPELHLAGLGKKRAGTGTEYQVE